MQKTLEKLESIQSFSRLRFALTCNESFAYNRFQKEKSMHRFDNLSCLDTALNTGAFLCSGDNVMVISWGMIGVMWGKKVFVAPVRESRYTKEFIDRLGTFTVSVPPMREMLDAVKFCGTKSGREYDKWAECALEKVKAKSIDGYVVGGCQRYFECKVVGAVPMGDMDLKDVENWYPQKDLHTFYFGEIIEEY